LTDRQAKQKKLESDYQSQLRVREAADDLREQRIASIEAQLSVRETDVAKREAAVGIYVPPVPMPSTTGAGGGGKKKKNS